MSKKTTEEFIAEAVAIHGSEKYNYDKAVYTGIRRRVEIWCEKHREWFWQTPQEHLRGHGCRRCAAERRSDSATRPKEDFVEQALQVHGDKYCYKKAAYRNDSIKIEIWCNKHELYFWQKPSEHLKGSGCVRCGLDKLSLAHTHTTDKFIEKSVRMHGDLYDYSEVVYSGAYAKVKIGCKRHDRVFEQTPHDHLSGSGCPLCAIHGFKKGIPGVVLVTESPAAGYTIPAARLMVTGVKTI